MPAIAHDVRNINVMLSYKMGIELVASIFVTNGKFKRSETNEHHKEYLVSLESKMELL